MARSNGGVQLARERLSTPDGDLLELDWARVPEVPVAETAPLVVLLHGLEGSPSSRYSLQSFRQLAKRGVQAVGLAFRSCGGTPNRTARFYHAGETGDLETALEHVAARRPGVPLGALGFSLGGNVLLKYLGERGADTPVRAAAAVSVPYDLAAGAALLERGMGRRYGSFFLRSLRRKWERKSAAGIALPDFAGVRLARTLREWDDAVTAPLHGFRDAAEYYARSSSQRFLERIRVPTLLLHADDDPFLPASSIPRAEAEANPCISAAFLPRGGHVGFVTGPPWRPRFWAEEEAAHFLANQLCAVPAGRR